VVLSSNKNQPTLSSGVLATPLDSATNASHYVP
jgi:hypothetical protein